MRPRRLTLVVQIAIVCAVLGGLGHPVIAGTATDQIRAQIEQMYRLVSEAGSAPDGASPVRKIADQMFDWEAMAEGALGEHWARRSPTERKEFARLFGDVFERAYLSKIQLADADRFVYLGDAPEGDHTPVRTRITTKKGTVIPVSYRVRMSDEGTWQVFDLDVDGVSLIDNYRTQFNSIIRRASYAELVNRLKAVRERRQGRADPPARAAA
ncbi:MAG TPA: ABC transporter substrate-binding protein [Methylomirabilota bacterium]|nr:ABC transporter substrate-binding protein [Methylomirabilota bacterium]